MMQMQQMEAILAIEHQEKEQLAARLAASGQSFCMACHTKEKNIICSPCLHVVYCEECKDEAVRLGENTCPVCRKFAIFVRVYI